jgi:hypothetical protein
VLSTRSTQQLIAGGAAALVQDSMASLERRVRRLVAISPASAETFEITAPP